MHIYTKIYEFAASAGAFEGFVYRKKRSEMGDLSPWVNNLAAAYHHLSSDVRNEFQSSLDQTLGRAIRSLVPELGEQDEMVLKLKSLVVGPLPKSSDDFHKEKWFQE